MAKVGTGAETNQHEQADETQFIYKSCTGDVINVSDQCLNVLPIHFLISKKESHLPSQYVYLHPHEAPSSQTTYERTSTRTELAQASARSDS